MNSQISSSSQKYFIIDSYLYSNKAKENTLVFSNDMSKCEFDENYINTIVIK